MKPFLKLVFLIVLLNSAPAISQTYPVFTQYIFDPYTINPSIIAAKNQAEINLLYRQQWTAIADGPQTILFNYQQPVNSRVTLGINIIDDKTVLLSNTSFLSTFGYKVPIAVEHNISFGLSFGVYSNRIRTEDIPDIDINDPVILNAQANNFAFNGQFGFNYTYKNLQIGYSLIQLVDNNPYSIKEFQEPVYNQLNNSNLLVQYKLSINSDFDLLPYALYRFSKDNLNYFEGVAFISYKNLIGIGAGYRQSFGPLTYLRATLKRIEIGYAYDLPSNKYSISMGASHEIQLKYRFGKIVESASRKQKQSIVADTQITQTEAPIIKQEEPIKQHVVENAAEEVVKPEVIVKPAEVIISEQPITISEPAKINHLLIVGSFKVKSNADRLLKRITEQGYTAELFFHPEDKLYYVYLPEYTTHEISLEKIESIRKSTSFDGAWFKKIKE